MLNIYNPNEQSGKSDLGVIKPVGASEKKADFRRYVDTSGDFGNKQLAISLWFVKHKVLFYRIGLGILLIFNIFLYIYNIGLWGSYLVGITDARRLELYASRFHNYSGFKAHFSPIPIDITSTDLFKSSAQKYDAVAIITNPNTRFVAEVEYRFLLNSTSTDLYRVKMLASQEGMLTALGIPEELAGQGNVVLKIENINWQRIDNHLMPDAITWQSERLNFSAIDPQFQSAFGAGSLGANRVTFKLKNNSAFSFKSPYLF